MSAHARKDPITRRAEIVAAARVAFARHTYAEVGVAALAEAAGVSKGLVYHYFPDGRPDVFAAVVRDLLDELLGRLRLASRAPFGPATRLGQLFGAFFGYFVSEPTTYRLLVREPWTTGSEEVEGLALAVRGKVAAEVAGVLAAAGLPADDLLVAGAGLTGYAMANVELVLGGHVDAEAAWELTVACAQAHLSGSVARPATAGGPGRALGTPASRPGDRSLPSPHAPIAPGGPGAGCT